MAQALRWLLGWTSPYINESPRYASKMVCLICKLREFFFIASPQVHGPGGPLIYSATPTASSIVVMSQVQCHRLTSGRAWESELLKVQFGNLGASKIKTQDSGVPGPTDRLIQDQGYRSIRVTSVIRRPVHGAAAVTNNGRLPTATQGCLPNRSTLAYTDQDQDQGFGLCYKVRSIRVTRVLRRPQNPPYGPHSIR